MKKICSTLFVFSAVLFSQNFVKADSTCNEKPVQGTTYTAGACIDTINVCMALGEPTPGEHPLPGDCFAKVPPPTIGG